MVGANILRTTIELLGTSHPAQKYVNKLATPPTAITYINAH